MLGPLCAAAALFRLADQTPGERPPDLWKALSEAVCRKPRDGRSRIAINDSKKLKRPNSAKRGHPLEHLERAVLAAVAQCDHPGPITTDESLLDALHARTEPQVWYAGRPLELPLGRTAEQLAVDAARLAGALQHAGIELVGLRCVIVCETEFNTIVARSGSKADATASAIRRLLHWCAARAVAPGSDHLRVVCDRQSGRSDYRPLLEAALPDWPARPPLASDRRVRYELDTGADERIASAAISFETESEERHLAVALASMTAKLVRELCMLRFNRYWAGRIPEIKPTAGYVSDARRWLEDAGGHLTDDERRALVRIA